MPIDYKQYDSASDFIDEGDLKFSRLISNLSNPDDRKRLMAYELYEDMYHNRPEHIRITIRGSADEEDDSIEIYMPSAKTNIEAVNRFLGKNFQVIPDPTMEQGVNEDGEAQPQPDQIAVDTATALNKLFKRERMKSKFNNLKRYGLMKGDALFHVRGDFNRQLGKRICIEELKPEHYFPIENPVTGEAEGCFIVDIIINPRHTPELVLCNQDNVVRRQTYMKVFNELGQPTGQIMSDLALYQIGAWDERVLPDEDIRRLAQITEPFFLPNGITQLPVYHWRNNPPPNSTFGMSQLAGTETVINAINQSMSDEDLTLIMQGLGVYWSDASPPMNSKGEEVEWEISPRSVVQVAAGGTFGRVSGISTIEPFSAHIEKLQEALQQGVGVPDLAVGIVDATIAESGIALLLKFGPLISQNAEKELDLIDMCDQFLYDLVHGWLPTYEGVNTEGIDFVTKFDDPMPRNQSKDLADLIQLWAAASSVLPVSKFYEVLNQIMGWNLDPTTDFPQALKDAQAIMEAQQPPMPPPMPGQGGSPASGTPPSKGGAQGRSSNEPGRGQGKESAANKKQTGKTN